MSRYFDLSNNHVLFVGEPAGALERSLMLPVEAFTSSGSTEEMTLVSQIFDCAKPSHNLNCPKSLCHCIQPTYFSKPVGIQLTYFPNSFLTTDGNVV